MQSESWKYRSTGQYRQFCPTDRKKRTIKNWIDWHLKKGAVGVVREKSPQKKVSDRKMKPTTALRRRNGIMSIGYSLWIALRREQCIAYNHCYAVTQ
jgi:hypothetical protein